MELFTALPDASIPEFHWAHGDDLCDCTHQRIGYWSNPYLGDTEKLRWCCLLKDLEDSFPQHFQHIKSFWDENKQEYIPGQMEWDGEDDMPRALWHRQIAIAEGLPVETIRERTRFMEPPKGNPSPNVDNPPMEASDGMNIYQAYGEIYAAHKAVSQNLDAALLIIARIQDGSIKPEDIEIHGGNDDHTD